MPVLSSGRAVSMFTGTVTVLPAWGSSVVGMLKVGSGCGVGVVRFTPGTSKVGIGGICDWALTCGLLTSIRLSWPGSLVDRMLLRVMEPTITGSTKR